MIQLFMNNLRRIRDTYASKLKSAVIHRRRILMKLKKLFITIVLLSFVNLSFAQTQSSVETVILKNPNFTDVLRIGIDTANGTVSVERCFDYSFEKANCQMIGAAMPMAEIENVRAQLDSQFNATATGAVVATATYFGVISFCLAKGKCSGLMNTLFQSGGKVDWGLWLAIGTGVAGGALGSSLGDTGAGEYASVLQIQEAIEKALDRDDSEEGALIVETQASLNKIVESFSMLQLLISTDLQ
jgi:hypothetical protein